METLPVERIEAGLPAALANAAAPAPADGVRWAEAAQGIMTTDTLPKAASARVQIGGRTVTVTGISKGAGMIKPNMATMLGYVATDAVIAQSALEQLVTEAADASFNRITIDGDTSTNDSFVLMATQAAYAIAHSPLVKTAFFASDPNLGRILAAVGYAGIDDLDQGLIDLFLDDVHVVREGGRHPDYREEDGQRVMKQSEITVRVDLRRGPTHDTVWTCDLSHDYVSINADYRS